MFTKEEIEALKSILQNADDCLLFELFGDVFQTVKDRLIEMKVRKVNQKPYQFHQRFSDLD